MGGQYKNVRYEGIKLNTDKAIPGNKYLVIYDTKDPKIATMLFAYPIKDCLDYQRYMKEFERKPLDITPYYRTPYAKHWLKDYSDNE